MFQRKENWLVTIAVHLSYI